MAWRLKFGKHQLVVEPFKDGRIRNVTKILLEGHRTFALNDKGQMFASGVRGDRLVMRHDKHSLSILDAAAKFGLLSKTAVTETLLMHKRREMIYNRYWAGQNLISGADKLEVTLPVSVVRKIARADRAYKKVWK